jgi:hypothetical protein
MHPMWTQEESQVRPQIYGLVSRTLTGHPGTDVLKTINQPAKCRQADTGSAQWEMQFPKCSRFYRLEILFPTLSSLDSHSANA